VKTARELVRLWNILAAEPLIASPDSNPLFIVDGDLPVPVGLATAAHEASHVMDYIIEYIGMDDKSGEFRGHGIGAVMRSINKAFKVGHHRRRKARAK
jgi:hypothetical protein